MHVVRWAFVSSVLLIACPKVSTDQPRPPDLVADASASNVSEMTDGSHTSSPLVDASIIVDSSVVDASPKKLSCAAQQCTGVGQCDAVLAAGRWIWTGGGCGEFYASGCSLAGPDCANLYADKASCDRAHAHCVGEQPRHL
jgi:hypothetical protein